MNAPGKVGPETINNIGKLAGSAAESLGLELVDVSFGAWKKQLRLTIYIDKPGGVSLEDCERMSKFLGELLDGEDPIPYRYFLEVSSPGPARPLKKAADFQKFQGSTVQIKTHAKLDGRRNFKGLLKDFQDNMLVIETEEGERIKISLEEVAKANLSAKNRR